MRAESRLGLRRELGRDDADLERSQNRLAAIQRLSLTKVRFGGGLGGTMRARAARHCTIETSLGGRS